jgi:CelD/BcsL family acetyltransferase involved in cellulose biosynthesis
MSMRVSAHHGIEGYAAVRDAWQALEPYACEFANHPNWIEGLSCTGSHLFPDIVWLRVDDEHGPVAATVLLLREQRTFGMALRVLEVPSRYGLLHADALVRRDASLPAVASLLLGAPVFKGRPCHVLRAEALRGTSTWLAMIQAMPIRQVEPSGQVSLFDTTLSAEAWHERVPAKLRAQNRKARTKAEQAGRFEIREFRTADEVAAGVDLFVSIEARSGKGPSTLEASSGDRELLKTAMTEHARDERAFVRIIALDDKPIAADLSIVVGARLYGVKTTFDDAFAHLTPGKLLLAELVERLCGDSAIDALDMLVHQPHLERWATIQEPLYNARVFRTAGAERLASAMRWLSDAGSRWSGRDRPAPTTDESANEPAH